MLYNGLIPKQYSCGKGIHADLRDIELLILIQPSPSKDSKASKSSLEARGQTLSDGQCREVKTCFANATNRTCSHCSPGHDISDSKLPRQSLPQRRCGCSCVVCQCSRRSDCQGLHTEGIAGFPQELLMLFSFRRSLAIRSMS